MAALERFPGSLGGARLLHCSKAWVAVNAQYGCDSLKSMIHGDFDARYPTWKTGENCLYVETKEQSDFYDGYLNVSLHHIKTKQDLGDVSF